MKTLDSRTGKAELKSLMHVSKNEYYDTNIPQALFMSSVPNLDTGPQFFRTCDPNELSQLILAVITDGRLPEEFLDSLNNDDKTICNRACMICWSITDGALVPREMHWQLPVRVILAERYGLDALVASGTHCLWHSLYMLLDNPADNQITITISPFKRLQATQDSDFNRRYGIRTVVINDDTKIENSWWDSDVTENVQHIATRTPGKAQHLVVTVEQLFKRPESRSHLPRLTMLMRQNQFNCLNMASLHFNLPGES